MTPPTAPTSVPLINPLYLYLQSCDLFPLLMEVGGDWCVMSILKICTLSRSKCYARAQATYKQANTVPGRDGFARLEREFIGDNSRRIWCARVIVWVTLYHPLSPS